jgi:hypothetical protein
MKLTPWWRSDPMRPAAANMRITLERLSPPETAGVIGEFVTNDDGRLTGGPALKGGKEFTVGVYEWAFYVGDVRSTVIARHVADSKSRYSPTRISSLVLHSTLHPKELMHPASRSWT